jgi:transposase-like protein
MFLDKKELKDYLKNNPVKSKLELNDLLKQLNKQVIEAMLDGELTHELGYEQNDKSEKETDNRRNGHTSKKVKTSTGEIEVSIPRDRKSEFEPVIVKKNQNDISGFDDKIISMYALGLTTRDIQKYVLEIYGYEISAEQVSVITNKVLEKVKEWQNRPLADLYPIVFLDAMVLKIRKDGIVRNSAVYGIIGITIDGIKECLGLWIGESESAKFWLYVLNEIKNRGVKDILIFSVDNLSGISEAIKTVFPSTEIQKCIVHQIRNSLAFVSWKERKEAAGDLKNIYRASTEEQGLSELKNFKAKWDKKYPHIGASWERNWHELSTFYKYPEEIRRLIYTTNPIESFNSRMKKVCRNKGAFPNEESVHKLLYLAVENLSKKWTMKIHNWGLIFAQLSVLFEERIKKYL